MSVFVLRLGHRIGRDKRISTHCGLVSRAFGAKGVYYSGEKDKTLEKSIMNVVGQWGGPFEISHVKNWRGFVKKFNGTKIHLSMYGLPVQKEISKIRKAKNLLVIIGGEKVPGDVYKMADFNIAITNQPHSEISSISCFLDYFFKGSEMNKRFRNSKIKIIPQARGKKIIQI